MALDRPAPPVRYSTRLISRVRDALQPWRERCDVLARRLRLIAIAAFVVLLGVGTALAVRRASAVPIESRVPMARSAATTIAAATGSRPTTGAEPGAASSTAAPVPSAPAASAPASRAISAGNSAVTPTTSVASLVVHAAGAVRLPGVVIVRPGSRVDDVVEAAGGATTNAELDGINLAAPVEDGQRVFVPFRGRPPVTVVTGAGDGSVVSPTRGGPGPVAETTILDLNTATADQLDTLPGVGPATAGAIIEFRTTSGPFRSVTQLLEVPGIGEAKLARIRPRVRV